MAETSAQRSTDDQESSDNMYLQVDTDSVEPIIEGQVWEVSPGVYYIGSIVQTSDGKMCRQGAGTQLVLDENGEEFVRYQGEWAGDKPSGKGVLTMGDEEYRGEFYQGEPNGQGTYKFANGDFFEGNFLDGQMNGDGTFFNTKGESIDGIFSKGKILIDGIPVDAFKNEAERKEQYLRIVEGKVPKRRLGDELPEPSYLENSDQLVGWITEGIRQRETMILARTQNYKGGIDTILQTLERKRAKYLFLSARDIPAKVSVPMKRAPKQLRGELGEGSEDESLHSQDDPELVWLYTLRDCIEDGLLLVVNVDYFTSKKTSDLSILPTLDSLFNVKALGRDSAEILAEFGRHKMEPPSVIHPGYSTLFLVNLKTEKPGKGDKDGPRMCDQSVERICRSYKWISQLGAKVRFGLINELAKPPPLYQTELMEESLNFENGMKAAGSET